MLGLVSSSCGPKTSVTRDPGAGSCVPSRSSAAATMAACTVIENATTMAIHWKF